MASITDCVSEGLKYPFRDIKKLLGFGVLLAVINALSTFISLKSFEIFRFIVHLGQKNNATFSHIPFSQLPAGDIYTVAGLGIVIFIVSLLIMGYQYNVVEFSIYRKEDLPGFGDILGMFINGIKYFAVSVAYSIIPVLVMACGILLVGDSSAFQIIMLVSMLLFIIAFFLMIMALNNMVAFNDITKAFDLREIIDNISNLGWGKYVGIILFALIAMMIISFAVGIVLSFFTVMFAATVNNQAVIISIVLFIIEGLFVDSYMGIFFHRVLGSIYRESVK